MDLDRLAREMLAREGVEPLTEAQCEAIFEYAEAAGNQRADAGSLKSEADFIAGVLSCIFALGRSDRLPAAWVFGPLMGAKLFQKKCYRCGMRTGCKCGADDEYLPETDCDDCGGTGAVMCTSCSGSGEGGHDGAICHECRGAGEVRCPTCEGAGKVGV